MVTTHENSWTMCSFKGRKLFSCRTCWKPQKSWVSHHDAIFQLNRISILSGISDWSVHCNSYRQTDNITRTESRKLNVCLSSCRCLQPIHWSLQVLRGEWNCSWSNADRRCSNYIWGINNFIAYKGATYNRGLVECLIRLGWNGSEMLWV